MHKFSKADIERISELRSKLREAADEIVTAYGPLNSEVANINTLLEAYNQLLTEANGVIEDIASEVQSEIDDKSEKWQEGDRGQAIIDWQSDLENFEFEALEMLDDIEVPELDHDGQLENLPEQANV